MPVLLYHGVGAPSDFANAADAQYGIDVDDFAKQMTMIKHAGYQTIDLQTFVDFVRGRRRQTPAEAAAAHVRRRAERTRGPGSASILRQLDFTAVMFVDVGRVTTCDPEYLTWDELQAMKTAVAGRCSCTRYPTAINTSSRSEHRRDRSVLRVQGTG